MLEAALFPESHLIFDFDFLTFVFHFKLDPVSVSLRQKVKNGSASATLLFRLFGFELQLNPRRGWGGGCREKIDVS
jgi:hypothetical protein